MVFADHGVANKITLDGYYTSFDGYITSHFPHQKGLEKYYRNS